MQFPRVQLARPPAQDQQRRVAGPGRFVPMGLLVAAVLLAFCTLPRTVFAQMTVPEAAAVRDVPMESAPVKLDGNVLFNLRGISAYPADKRAALVAERIRKFAADATKSVEDLRAVEQDGYTDIQAGDLFLLAVVNADAELERVERKVLVFGIMLKIREAVTAYREDRQSDVLLRNAGYALGATVLAGGVIFLVLWGFRRLLSLAERRIGAAIEQVEARAHALLKAGQLLLLLQGLLRLTRLLLILLVVYFYLNAVLGLFPWTRGLAVQLFDIVFDPLRVIGTGFVDYLPDLVFLVVIVVLFRFALKMLHGLFSAIHHEKVTLRGFEPEWAWPTYRLLRVVVLAFALVMAYPYLPGSDSAAFQGVSIFLGVLLSLGSSSVIANVIAGYTMTYRRAFAIGDRIRVGEHVGDVAETRLLVTHLRSLKNEEVVIPNSVILGSEVVNYSSLAAEEGLLLHTTVGIGYEVPWRQVEAMLVLAAERTPGLQTNRKPFVLQKSLADYAVNYELNAYTNRADNMPALYTALHRSILDVFNEYGVQIMTPSYVADSPEPKLVPRDQWYAAPARKPLSPAE